MVTALALTDIALVTMLSPNMETIKIVEVPSDVGGYSIGPAKAPEAILKAGLAQKLQDAGYRVTSVQALEQPRQYTANMTWEGSRAEKSVLNVMTEVFNTLMTPLPPACIPLVLGGDSSITPAVMAAVVRQYEGEKVGILYVDGDPCLDVPEECRLIGHTGTGTLNSMVVSHLTHRQGCLESIQQRFSRPDRSPLANHENIYLWGMDPRLASRLHFAYLLDNGIRCLTYEGARDCDLNKPRPREWMEERVDRFIVHFSANIWNAGIVPLANVPRHHGLNFQQGMAPLKNCLGSEKLAGLVITEVDPSHDPLGKVLEKFVDGLVFTFKMRKDERERRESGSS